jgi:hypothetical protein
MNDTPICRDERRKADVRLHPLLNGIDFVEYFEDRSDPDPANWLYWLEVTFLKPAPAGLIGNPQLVRIEGGARVVGIRPVEVTPGAAANQLTIRVDQPGDFSTYVLHIESAALDRELASAPFGFKAGCPSDFDCRQAPYCPPPELPAPLLDYLAKDYASFRRLLLDLIPVRNPKWVQRNPADLGIALVELFAYAGDHLSYMQDAVATESYLDTCRQRISARRHARLIDYSMHEGRNAWTFVQLDVSTAGTVPAGTKLLTRLTRALRNQTAVPGHVVPAPVQLDFDGDPALARTEVFETTARSRLRPEHNELRLHAFGDRDCCLPIGAVHAYLYGLDPPAGPNQTAFRPQLEAGDYLLLEEVAGPVTGLAADADPRHRQVVRIIEAENTEDPVYQEILLAGELQRVTPADEPRLPLQKVTWRKEDALTFPLCLSTQNAQTGPLDHVSLARGNVVPCDHGRTLTEALEPPPASATRTGLGALALTRAPLTFQAMPSQPTYDEGGRLREARHRLDVDARHAAPAIVLLVDFRGSIVEIWEPVPHLLDSRAFDRHFVVEVNDGGRAQVRFGDDEYGRRPLGALRVHARYRVGNGRAGNIGPASLAHVVEPSAADMVDPNDPAAPIPSFPGIARIRQPLPARDGVEPETIEEVRELAPSAFHAEQFRAVTQADYEQAAMKLDGVAAAKCTFRWTGSWHTVFVALHPHDPADLITRPGGRVELAPDFARRAHAHLTRYKLAGYDLALRTAQYVPLEITIEVCVGRGHFRGDVIAAVARALSNRRNPDGTIGFFHPVRFAFGASVYLSRVYEAVMAVEGVDSASVTVFERYWHAANHELETGVLPMGPFEIARLDNDANFPENGVLTLVALGGA